MCKRVSSLGFGPGLDSMSPKKLGAGPPEWQIQFAQYPPPPTAAHQPLFGAKCRR